MFFPLFSLFESDFALCYGFKFSLKSTVPFDFAPEFRRTCVRALPCHHLIPVKTQFASKNRYFFYCALNLKRNSVFLVFSLN